MTLPATSLYQLAVRVPQALADATSDWLESIALAVTIDLHDDQAEVAGLFATRADDAVIRQQLAALAPGLIFDWQQIPSIDWLAETARHGAGPVGCFTLQQSPLPATALRCVRSLYVESTQAFGDGFHATTHGCLLALQEIQKRTAVRSYADVGCGTGVLALAVRKLWPPAYGVLGDIDAAAVGIARLNAQANGGQGQMRFVVGPGLQPRPFMCAKPYSLVVANILAGPLCKIAPTVRAALAEGGYVVLSGLLESQRNMVLAAYRQQRLRLVKSSSTHGWVTLILRK